MKNKIMYENGRILERERATFYKNNTGITLVVLVITTIILLLLAGITIVGLKGNGLFGKTEIAKQKTRYTSAKEIVNLKLMEIQVGCTEKNEGYNIVKIAEGMKQAEDITIEKYYNKETAKIKEDISEELTNLEGIVVSADEYSEYKFLIGEKCKIEKVLEGKVTDTTSKNDFIEIVEFEAKQFNSSNTTETDSIEYSYEKKKIEGTNRLQILIIIKDKENGLKEIKYPNGDKLKCNGKNEIGIDYTIEKGIEYIFEVTSNNGYTKKITIYEDLVNIKLGTSYITIDVEETSIYGNIEKYKYIVDGIEYESTERQYTKEGLEAETVHQITVIAIDEEQNEIILKETTVKTEPRTYIYKQGNEYEDITGGWGIGLIGGENAAVGSVIKNNEEGYIEVKTWGFWCGLGCYTKKTIDLTEYSKIKVDIFDCTWTDICGYEQVAIICGDKLGVTYKDELEDKIYELDISNVIPNSNIISVQIGNGANGKIRNIWLEK